MIRVRLDVRNSSSRIGLFDPATGELAGLREAGNERDELAALCCRAGCTTHSNDAAGRPQTEKNLPLRGLSPPPQPGESRVCPEAA